MSWYNESGSVEGGFDCVEGVVFGCEEDAFSVGDVCFVFESPVSCSSARRFLNSNSACSSRDSGLVGCEAEVGCGEVSATFVGAEFEASFPNCPSLEGAELDHHPIMFEKELYK